MSKKNITTSIKRFGINSGANKDQPPEELFNHFSKSRTSHVITVTPSNPILISSFGLGDDVKITLHKVRVSGGTYPIPGDCICTCIEGDDPSISDSEPLLIQCKPVIIDKCMNIIYLTIPGHYAFQIDKEEHIGTFILLAEPVPLHTIPNGLVIGNRFNDKYIGVKE